MSQDQKKTQKDRGRSRVGAATGATGVGQMLGSKRFRGSSDELGQDPSHDVDPDPDYLIDNCWEVWLIWITAEEIHPAPV